MQESRRAFLFVQTERGLSGIAGRLRAIPGIVLAVDLSGPYDALALASFVGDGRAIDRIANTIRELPGVLRAIVAPITPRADTVAAVNA